MTSPLNLFRRALLCFRVAAPAPLALLLLGAFAHAPAQTPGNPPNWCRNGAFTGDVARFRLGRVRGPRGARAHFHGDAEGCPSPRCREKAYVIPGDEVIIAHGFGDWVCAWFQPAKGAETVGWLEASRLDVSEDASAATPARFVGVWTFYENFLDVRPGRGAGRLSVEGQAYWHGLGDNVHVGELAGEVTPEGRGFTYEDDSCRVAAQLVGAYLVVEDNNQCGGVNVSFSGVYRKKQTRGKPHRD
ncbi:MAG TPA: hypothetical protein VEQ42_07270 [Pyrinomonadaceae bacterium]|nr:hypothetical protein [Pyrinomonadaceae bacterium]